MKPHEILEISPGASEKEIKAAYKKLAKKYHPDMTGGDEAKFKELSQAYTALMEPEPEPPSSGGEGFDPFFDQAVFNAIFGRAGMPGGGQTHSQVVNRVGIDPERLINGGTFNYTYQTIDRINGQIRTVNKSQKVTIEPDTPVMARVALPSQGGSHFVFLELIPIETSRYKVSELIHLTETHKVDVFTAMTGGEVAVTAPNQKTIKVKVPAGTQSGTIHRIRGLGLRLPNGTRGDYNVQFIVEIPTITGTDKRHQAEDFGISEMKLLPIGLLILALSSTGAFAVDNPLKGVPKDVLIEGMQTAAVCALIDGYGMARLLEFYRQEPSTSSAEAVVDLTGAQDLYDDMNKEGEFAHTIVQSIEDQYGVSEKDLFGSVDQTLHAAHAGLKEKYDQIDEANEFIGAYADALNTCVVATKSFLDKAKPAKPLLETLPPNN